MGVRKGYNDIRMSTEQSRLRDATTYGEAAE
jgi:hypothetical protein